VKWLSHFEDENNIKVMYFSPLTGIDDGKMKKLCAVVSIAPWTSLNLRRKSF